MKEAVYVKKSQSIGNRIFKEGELSLAQAAKLANMTLADFITHISRQGIPVINQSDDDLRADMDTIDEWLV